MTIGGGNGDEGKTNFGHGLLGAAGVILVPLLHVFLAENLICGGLALRFVDGVG